MIAIQADQKGGAAIFFRDAAGNDTDNTLVPAIICQYDGFRQLVQGQLRYGLLEDVRLNSLPLAIEFA